MDFLLPKLHISKILIYKNLVQNVWVSGGYRSVDVHDPRSTAFHLTMEYDTVPVCNANEIWVTYINNVLSNKTILFDILDF